MSTWIYNANATNAGGANKYAQTDFDASFCSSVYRDDITTVQPSSLTNRYFIKY